MRFQSWDCGIFFLNDLLRHSRPQSLIYSGFSDRNHVAAAQNFPHPHHAQLVLPHSTTGTCSVRLRRTCHRERSTMMLQPCFLRVLFIFLFILCRCNNPYLGQWRQKLTLSISPPRDGWGPEPQRQPHRNIKKTWFTNHIQHIYVHYIHITWRLWSIIFGKTSDQIQWLKNKQTPKQSFVMVILWVTFIRVWSGTWQCQSLNSRDHCSCTDTSLIILLRYCFIRSTVTELCDFLLMSSGTDLQDTLLWYCRAVTRSLWH